MKPILGMLCLITALCPGIGVSQAARISSAPAVMSAQLEYLVIQHERGTLKKDFPEIAARGELSFSVQMSKDTSRQNVASLEASGFLPDAPLLQKFERRKASDTSPVILSGRAPLGRIRAISKSAQVEKMEAHVAPFLQPTLDVSSPEVDASDGAWLYTDDSSLPLLGDGLRVALIDQGVDVFHPAFFYDDGGSFDWIDDNSNSTFDPGVDCVDLNTNFTCEANELLDFSDGEILGMGGPTQTNGVFDYDIDWLFNDDNANGTRDYGTGFGYGEGDPTFGERVFYFEDANEDGILDMGETLTLLSTPKIVATYNAGGITRRRGIDLMQTDLDTQDISHGTKSTGIICAQRPGRRMTGLAPNSEILMADWNGTGASMETLASWAETEGADVIFEEVGEWIWNFLDGSSTYETLLDTQSAAGIARVSPSGNLASGNKHTQFTVSAASSVNSNFNITGSRTRLYADYLWLTPANALDFQITTPTLITSGVLPTTSSWTSTMVGTFRIWSRQDTSPRGTVRFDLWCEEQSFATVDGVWTVEVINNAGASEFVHGFASDNIGSWTNGAKFTNFLSTNSTATWPSTADSTVTCGSYSIRGSLGTLSGFSGRGPRIDGTSVLDVCSPGDADIFTMRSKDDNVAAEWGWYRRFSGTSAAVPHAAAGAALLKQYIPALTSAEIKTALRAGALEDANTGATPNVNWGEGKLRILQALIEADRTAPAWDTTTGVQSVTNDGGGCAAALDISWNAATDVFKNPVTYHIYRDTVSGFTPSPANLVGSTQTLALQDAPVTPGVPYYYVVRTEDLAIEPNEDLNLAELSGTATGDVTPPAQVANTLSASKSGADVFLDWGDPAEATSYRVYWSADPSDVSTLLGEPVPSELTDSSTPASNTFYKTTALDVCGNETVE